MQDASSSVRGGDEATAQQENEELGFRELGLRGEEEFESGVGVCMHLTGLNLWIVVVVVVV